jgi:peptidoglycan/LPS O-acetylase OafA/YrhL
MRVLAAWAVLASHAVPLSYGSNDRELLFRASGGQSTFGELAVAVFFVISGYLISQSYDRVPNPVRFVWARALRLMPALAVTVFVLAFVAGPLLTTSSLREYFGSASLVRFLVVNLSFVDFWGYLPGVLENNPYRGVNGSLWTLHYEVWCYGVVLALGVLRLLTKQAVLAAFVAALAASIAVPGPLFELLAYFLAGSVICFWRPALRGWVAALCLVPLCATLAVGGFHLACATAGAYLVMYLALGTKPSGLIGRADLSYGVYVWAYPVQQLVVATLGPSWWVNVLASTPIVLGLAWLSWHVVEAPALALKDLGRRRPAVA